MPVAAAASTPILDASVSYTTSDMIRITISIIVLVAGLCSIVFIIWGGLMLILSGGKDDKVQPAVNSIRYAVIGIIVIVVAIFVAPRVTEMLGLGSYQYLSPKSIFDTISVLMNRVFGDSSGAYTSTSGEVYDFTDL